MAWDHLSINRPHLAYAILGGFTSLFMLVSLFVKEKLYIGEATVATICGIIFGPHAANLFDPNSWGNVDQITLECSRIVLVVQCFAVGVELPKAYMTRHWRSVVFLLVPVMTFGWLITSVFIWALIRPLNWLDSLCCAACVTATDPVLASSVVGKGKFAKRVPKHLRDLLSAESGCNDGMAFPFIYLSLYLIRYRPDASKVFEHWFILTILYECIFGAFYGCCVGYAGRRLIRWAEQKQIIDRESFLVFYFTLALFCAGTGSMLGVDDLLVGFCAGVAFSNDGWFAQRTEESHVSNVIDLLLNLAYFVYFGSIIPWEQYNRPEWGLEPWRLVCISLLVIFFRRIPIMVALKPIIPDIKTWRESFFAGHFGPIGVGAIFVAILARAELEVEDTTPLAVLPSIEENSHLLLIELIWPITTFLVITSIVVHGSSIAVFTLGKRLNQITLTMSYTQGQQEDSWVNRLPFLSRGQSLSIRKPDDYSSSNEKLDGLLPPGTLPPPGGVPGGHSRPSSIKSKRRSNVGGQVSDSAIAPRRRNGLGRPRSRKGRPDEDDANSPERTRQRGLDSIQLRRGEEMFEEGNDIIIEDEQGEVVRQLRSNESGELEDTFDESNDTRAGHPGAEPPHPIEEVQKLVGSGEEEDKTDLEKPKEKLKQKPKQSEGHRGGGRSSHKAPARRHGKATAYQSGNNVIVEDEDGEVIKVIRTNTNTRPPLGTPGPAGGRRASIQRLGSYFTGWKGGEASTTSGLRADDSISVASNDDHGVHLHNPFSGRRMSRHDVIHHLRGVDPRHRDNVAKAHDIPAELVEAAKDLDNDASSSSATPIATGASTPIFTGPKDKVIEAAERTAQRDDAEDQLERLDTNVSGGSAGFDEETAVERRRRLGALGHSREDDTDDDDVSPGGIGDETAAEKKRRMDALGLSTHREEDEQAQSDSDDDGTERQPPVRRTGIRFAL